MCFSGGEKKSSLMVCTRWGGDHLFQKKKQNGQNVRWWTGWVLRTSTVCLPLISLGSPGGCCNESATLPRGNGSPLTQVTATSFSLGGEIYCGLSCCGWWPQSAHLILSPSPVKRHRRQPQLFQSRFLSHFWGWCGFVPAYFTCGSTRSAFNKFYPPTPPPVRCIRWSDICSYSLKSK